MRATIACGVSKRHLALTGANTKGGCTDKKYMRVEVEARERQRTERDTETLRRADGNVDTEFARGLQHRQGKKVGRADRQRLQ